MLVCMTVWSSKNLSLSRKVILWKNGSSAVCDVSQCLRLVFLSYAAFCAWRCFAILQGFSLNPSLEKHFGLFATKIFVPVWMLRILNYDIGIRTKGRVDLSLGRSVFLHCALWRVGPQRFISCTFKDVSYSSGALLRNFLTCRILWVKRCELKVNRLVYGTWSIFDKFKFFVNRLVVRSNSRCKVFIIWFPFLGYTIVIRVIVTWCFRQIADCRLAVKWSDGAVVAQMFWFGMKDVFSRIAEDVAGQGLDHVTFTFVLTRISC